MANMAGLTTGSTTIEKENLDLSDHEVILAPHCSLVYHNTKTGERKGLTYDSLTERLLPSSLVPRQ